MCVSTSRNCAARGCGRTLSSHTTLSPSYLVGFFVGFWICFSQRGRVQESPKMDESLPGDHWGSHRRTFSPRVPVAAGVRGPSVGNAGAAIALCCALHSNSFGFPNNQLKSFPCVFFTKEVLQSQKYIFRRGDCVFSPPSGQHPSTEGEKKLRVE